MNNWQWFNIFWTANAIVLLIAFFEMCVKGHNQAIAEKIIMLIENVAVSQKYQPHI